MRTTKERERGRSFVARPTAEGERSTFDRPSGREVEDRFAPTFHYVPNALRGLSTPPPPPLSLFLSLLPR